MINRFLLILISAAILSHTLSSVVIFAGYTLNKDFITKNYCINKDKPKLSCEGKCHLMKELKAHEENESKPLSPLKEKLETLVYLSVFNSTPIYDNNIVVHISMPYIEKLPAAFHNKPLQPPRA